MSFALIRGPIPEQAKPRLDRLCFEYRRTYGLSHGETMAACVLIGIQTLEREGAIPAPILSAVRA